LKKLFHTPHLISNYTMSAANPRGVELHWHGILLASLTAKAQDYANTNNTLDSTRAGFLQEQGLLSGKIITREEKTITDQKAGGSETKTLILPQNATPLKPEDKVTKILRRGAAGDAAKRWKKNYLDNEASEDIVGWYVIRSAVKTPSFKERKSHKVLSEVLKQKSIIFLLITLENERVDVSAFISGPEESKGQLLLLPVTKFLNLKASSNEEYLNLSYMPLEPQIKETKFYKELESEEKKSKELGEGERWFNESMELLKNMVQEMTGVAQKTNV